jgi:protease I
MKTIVIIAQEGYQDHELGAVKDAFDKHGIEYDIASPTGKECTGKFGGTIVPDKPLNYVELSEYDCVVVIGGPGALALGSDPVFNNIIKTAFDNKQKIAAICVSPMLLAKAGILADKKATVFPAPETLKAFRDFKVKYEKHDVVRDGDIITANGPDAAAKFADAVVKMVLEK